jgi:hypothetical protein
LDFVTHTESTKWNRALLNVLSAEGDLFIGDKSRAILAARETLASSQSVFAAQFVAPSVAAVYAWSGAADDATALLERASTQVWFWLLPAMIARDPLYTVPLANNARYKALQAKLEAQMAATKLE